MTNRIPPEGPNEPNLQEIVDKLRKQVNSPSADDVANAIIADPNFQHIAGLFKKMVNTAMHMILDEAAKRKIPRMVITSIIATEFSIGLSQMMAAMIHSVNQAVPADQRVKSRELGLEQIPRMFFQRMLENLPELIDDIEKEQREVDAKSKKPST